MPFFISIICFIIKHSSKKIDFLAFFSYFVVSLFVFQQQIFTKLFEMNHCEKFQLDDIYSESYLKNSLGIKCYTTTYYFWMFYIIIPFLCFYGIFIPFFTQAFAYSKRSSFSNRTNIMKYDFLMREYFKFKDLSFL